MHYTYNNIKRITNINTVITRFIRVLTAWSHFMTIDGIWPTPHLRRKPRIATFFLFASNLIWKAPFPTTINTNLTPSTNIQHHNPQQQYIGKRATRERERKISEIRERDVSGAFSSHRFSRVMLRCAYVESTGGCPQSNVPPAPAIQWWREQRPRRTFSVNARAVLFDRARFPTFCSIAIEFCISIDVASSVASFCLVYFKDPCPSKCFSRCQ